MNLFRRRKLRRLRNKRAAINIRRAARHELTAARDRAWALYDRLPRGPHRIDVINMLHPRLFGIPETADHYRRVCQHIERIAEILAYEWKVGLKSKNRDSRTTP